jgi:hypothetical protein
MLEAEASTLTAPAAPTVLAIGCPPTLLDLCRRVLARTGGVMKECDVPRVATVAAERKPLVLLLPEDVYAFDPAEFSALARDVRAVLLLASEDVGEIVLEAQLSLAITRALQRRDEQATTGRYVMLGSPRVEVVSPAGARDAERPRLSFRVGSPASSRRTALG